MVGAVFAILKTSDLFIDLARSLGKRLGLKEYFIGSLIVGIGTSLPELFTSLAAVAENSPELVAPTVYGTIIANLGAGFGLGVVVLYFWVRTDHKWYLITREHAYAGGALNLTTSGTDKNFVVPLVVAALSVVLSVLLCLDNQFSRGDAGIFVLGYVAFLSWELHRRRQGEDDASDEEESQSTQRATGLRWVYALNNLGAPVAVLILFVIVTLRPGETLIAGPIWDSVFLALWLLITGIFFWLYVQWRGTNLEDGSRPEFSDYTALVFGGKATIIVLFFLAASIFQTYLLGVATVKMLMALAVDLNIGGPVLAASALAVGTSLPDIAVAFNVARRGLHRMLTGHILQSNIFDVFLIMGLCGLMVPLGGVFTGSARLSLVFSLVLTVPLLLTLRTRRINLTAAIGLLAGLILFLASVFIFD